VVLLRLETAALPNRIEAELFKTAFPFYPSGEKGVWFGLVGIDLECAPGRYQARITGYRGASQLFRGTYPLDVAKKDFPVRHLKVAPKYTSPPAEAMARIREESRLVGALFDTVTPEKFWSGSFLRPVPGAATSSFGKRSVFNGQPRSPHSGTDFRASRGTPINAPNHGKVVLARNLYFAGNTVMIDHGLGLYSYFAHLSEFRVSAGDQVEKGDVVGLVGATGRVTGPHLHWTTKVSGSRVDPLSLLEVMALEEGAPNP
jgi:murein DD-endopeptidase MepM/ murein hydrolase activator NlpD